VDAIGDVGVGVGVCVATERGDRLVGAVDR